MSWLLDTNVVSELVRTRPNVHVVRWFESRQTRDLYLPSIVVAELTLGAHKLGGSGRGGELLEWIDSLCVQFAGRILAFDERSARTWGRLIAEGDLPGRSRDALDTGIAAIALEHALVVVTRNVRDFDHDDVETFDPFAA